MRDLGLLGKCMLEGQEGAGLRSPRRRGLALLFATLLQFTLLGALILIPLLVRGERLQATWIEAPPPIYDPQVSRPEQNSQTRGEPTKRGLRPPTGGKIHQPPLIPPEVQILRDEDEAVPDVGREGPGMVGAILIPGSDGSRGWRPPFPEPPRPAPSQPRERLRITDMHPAKLIHRVEPVYPKLAIQARLEGTVVLRAVIATDGAVRETQLVSGPYLLAQAAMQAVLQWRYQPTLLNGQPVEVETRITVIFTLNR